jgi:hypothetical protein
MHPSNSLDGRNTRDQQHHTDGELWAYRRYARSRTSSCYTASVRTRCSFGAGSLPNQRSCTAGILWSSLHPGSAPNACPQFAASLLALREGFFARIPLTRHPFGSAGRCSGFTNSESSKWHHFGIILRNNFILHYTTNTRPDRGALFSTVSRLSATAVSERLPTSWWAVYHIPMKPCIVESFPRLCKVAGKNEGTDSSVPSDKYPGA